MTDVQMKQILRTGELFLKAGLFLLKPLTCCISPPLFQSAFLIVQTAS